VMEQVAADRLRSKETVILNHSVKKCAAKVCHLQNLLRTEQSQADCSSAAEAACRELELYSLEVDMAQLTAQTCQQQLEDYQVLESRVKFQVESTEADIDKLTEELRVAKKVRQYKEQYEALAKIVNRHPSKPATTREQAEMQLEIKKLEEEKLRLDEQMSVRRKQFALLMRTIDDLSMTLREDAALDDDAEGESMKGRSREEDNEDEDEDEDEDEETEHASKRHKRG
jgi:THO complex subunit 7